MQAGATEANAKNIVGLLTSPAQNNPIICLSIFSKREDRETKRGRGIEEKEVSFV